MPKEENSLKKLKTYRDNGIITKIVTVEKEETVLRFPHSPQKTKNDKVDMLDKSDHFLSKSQCLKSWKHIP